MSIAYENKPRSTVWTFHILHSLGYRQGVILPQELQRQLEAWDGEEFLKFTHPGYRVLVALMKQIGHVVDSEAVGKLNLKLYCRVIYPGGRDGGTVGYIVRNYHVSWNVPLLQVGPRTDTTVRYGYRLMNSNPKTAYKMGGELDWDQSQAIFDWRKSSYQHQDVVIAFGDRNENTLEYMVLHNTVFDTIKAKNYSETAGPDAYELFVLETTVPPVVPAAVADNDIRAGNVVFDVATQSVAQVEAVSGQKTKVRFILTKKTQTVPTNTLKSVELEDLEDSGSVIIVSENGKTGLTGKRVRDEQEDEQGTRKIRMDQTGHVVQVPAEQVVPYLEDIAGFINALRVLIVKRILSVQDILKLSQVNTFSQQAMSDPRVWNMLAATYQWREMSQYSSARSTLGIALYPAMIGNDRNSQQKVWKRIFEFFYRMKTNIGTRYTTVELEFALQDSLYVVSAWSTTEYLFLGMSGNAGSTTFDIIKAYTPNTLRGGFTPERTIKLSGKTTLVESSQKAFILSGRIRYRCFYGNGNEIVAFPKKNIVSIFLLYSHVVAELYNGVQIFNVSPSNATLGTAFNATITKRVGLDKFQLSDGRIMEAKYSNNLIHVKRVEYSDDQPQSNFVNKWPILFGNSFRRLLPASKGFLKLKTLVLSPFLVSCHICGNFDTLWDSKKSLPFCSKECQQCFYFDRSP